MTAPLLEVLMRLMHDLKKVLDRPNQSPANSSRLPKHLANKWNLPRHNPGEQVVIFQSGASGFTANPQAFLGHPVYAEVLV